MSLSPKQSVSLTVQNGIRYLPLLKNLIARDQKKRYRQSILGYAWCVLNPLLIMIIMTIVFSKMFHNKIENFPVYLFAGRMMFSFITDSTGSILRSITGNGQLMRKTRIPYYIFPLASLGGAIVNFCFQLIAFAIVLIFTGTPVTIHVIAFIPICLEMIAFSFGLGLLLAVSEVFVRDTNYLYAAFTTAWMFLSVLFYPLTNLPETIQKIVVRFNPAYFFIDMSRSVFHLHEWPSGIMMLRGGIVAVIFLTIALFVYSKVKKDLILYT